MIVEGIVTTLNGDDELNIAPMGPIVDASMTTFVFRPFRSSTTYRNLKVRPYGVFHIVDDVLLIARAALDRLETVPTTHKAERIVGRVLSSCCRWYEFEVTSYDDSTERTNFNTTVVHTGRLRDMFGFNRAKHAVLEATILATRLHLVPEIEVRNQLEGLASPVEKTAGPQEKVAFELVTNFVDAWYRRSSSG